MTGCDRVSPGCDHCYALTMAARLKAMGQARYQNDGDPRTSGPGFALTLHPEALVEPLRWRKPTTVFVNSMSDLFHADVPDEFIGRVWQTMSSTPQHTFQVLSKRADRMERWLRRWHEGAVAEPYAVRDVPSAPGYQVSTWGEVFGPKRPDKPLASDPGEQGHLRVAIHRDGRPVGRKLVHRLVLAAFVRPPQPGEQGCHRNGDPTDNRLSNLRWGSQELNWQDRVRHGSARSWSKLNEADVSAIRVRAEAGETAYRIARDFGVSDTQVRNVITHRQWAAVPEPARLRAPSRNVLGNCWVGVSVESPSQYGRIRHLQRAPAAVRFLSCEPLLAPLSDLPLEDIQWVIAGGESGHGARPCELDWLRSLRNQCQGTGVAFFLKQLGTVAVGGRGKGGHGDAVLDGRRWTEMPCARCGRPNCHVVGRECDGVPF